MTTAQAIELDVGTWEREHALEISELCAENFAMRLLPVFGNIGQQATEARSEFYNLGISALSRDYSYYDPIDISEQATEHGIKIFGNLQFVQQQLLGLATSGLYHLWERMIKQILNKEFSRSCPWTWCQIVSLDVV